METLISKKIPRIFTHQNKYSIPGEESNNGSENDANYPTVQRLSKPTPKVVTDVIYENQRGFFLLGVPKFSPYLLNPVDPPAWCDKNWRGISTEISLFPLPDPSWEWMDDRWLVDMSGDIDPFGWQYAVRFRGHNWRGHSKPLQSFARRRKWIRRRRRADQTESSGEVAVDITPAARSSLDIPYGVTSPSPTGMSDNAPDSPLTGPLSSNQYTPMSSMTSLTCEPDQNPSHYPMLIEIKQSRIDREKLQIVQDHLTKGVQLNEFMVEWMMNNLDYETSRKRLLQMIVDYKAQPESGISGYIGIERAIASPPLSPKMLLSPSTQQRLNVSHQYSHSADELRIYGTSNYDTKSRNVSNRNSLTFFSDKKPLFNLENYN